MARKVEADVEEELLLGAVLEHVVVQTQLVHFNWHPTYAKQENHHKHHLDCLKRCSQIISTFSTFPSQIIISAKRCKIWKIIMIVTKLFCNSESMSEKLALQTDASFCHVLWKRDDKKSLKSSLIFPLMYSSSLRYILALYLLAALKKIHSHSL